MSSEEQPLSEAKRISRRKQKRDPGIWLQEYLAGSASPEETLFKINELLHAGQIENTRKYVRAPLSAPVIFRLGESTAMGISYTLSQKGMFIKCPNPPAVGSRLQIGLALPDGGDALQLEAEVIQSNPLSKTARNSNLSGMSVVFRKISAEDRRRIDRLVRAHARRMRKTTK